MAEAKAKLSELLARVERGERVLVTKRGRPVAALVPPDQVSPPAQRYLGLAAVAGALADWDDLETTMDEVYRSRRTARDREVPELS